MDFPEQAFQSNFAVYCTTTEVSIITPSFWAFSEWLATAVSNYTIISKGKIVPYHVTSFESYYAFLAMGVPQSELRAQFVSADNKSSMIGFAINISYSSTEAITYATYLREQIAQFWESDLNPTVEATLTGIPAFVPIMQESVERWHPADLQGSDANGWDCPSDRIRNPGIHCALATLAVDYRHNAWDQVSRRLTSPVLS